MAFLGQFLGAYIIFNSVIKDRELVLLKWQDFIPRLIFSLIIQRAIGKDSSPINFSNSLLELRLLDGNFVRMSIAYLHRYSRSVFDSFCQAVITYRIISSDVSKEESHMDLVMSFTALFVLCDIDQLMSLSLSGIEKYIEDIKNLDSERYLYIRFQEKKHCKCCFVTCFSWITCVISSIISWGCLLFAQIALPTVLVVMTLKKQ